MSARHLDRCPRCEAYTNQPQATSGDEMSCSRCGHRWNDRTAYSAERRKVLRRLPRRAERRKLAMGHAGH